MKIAFIFEFFLEAPYGSGTVQRLAPAEAKNFVPHRNKIFSEKKCSN